MSSDRLRQQFEGQLCKYTNVMKGWQYRYFILDPESGVLDYFLNETERKQRPRGSVHLAAAVISPSDEDSNTFTVNSASGELFKLRAADARARQQWVNRLRAVAEMHTLAIAQNNPPLPPREHHSSSVLSANNGTMSVSNLSQNNSIHCSLAILDAFSSVREHLRRAESTFYSFNRTIEDLPASGEGLHNTCEHLLLLKATSQAIIWCLNQCLSILQQQQLYLIPPSTSISGSTFYTAGSSGSCITPNNTVWPSSGSKSTDNNPTVFSMYNVGDNVFKDNESVPSLDSVNSSPSIGKTTPKLTQAPFVEKNSSSSLDTPSSHKIDRETVIPLRGLDYNLEPAKVNPEDEVTDDDDSEDSIEVPVEEHKSVILHLLSQLKLGMDLTRVVLPTFLLERRSLLEMFADCMGHPHLFTLITEGETPEIRMLSAVEWYLTSFHMGRNSSVAKKPYNPIIGETFHCSWCLPANENSAIQDNSSDRIIITYVAEQVSHHPPITAFYVECPQKQMCLNASIWTKSNFSGMSVGVTMVGDVSLYLGEHQERYDFSLPSGYARSIISVPWVELGGKVMMNSNTGYSANIIFHTKPFYGGKVHQVTGEIKNDGGNMICKFQGDWNTHYEFTFLQGETKLIEIKDIPIHKKRVRRLEDQGNFESRKLWHRVTESLRNGDIQAATEYKRQLEDQQRSEERIRREEGLTFPPVYFKKIGDQWVFKNMLIKL